MSKTATGLIQHCKDKLGTPYVYGAKGEVLTQAILDRLARENPGTYTSTYKAKAARYIVPASSAGTRVSYVAATTTTTQPWSAWVSTIWTSPWSAGRCGSRATSGYT